MAFEEKADYEGPFDGNGIPLLDYHGKIGKQYNPIAIAQYGLGNYNLYKRTGDIAMLKKAESIADWLVDNISQNEAGCWVWNHLFDWEYFRTLKAPWYSALAQGQSISLLLRLYSETGGESYKGTADRAFRTMLTPIKDGGVLYVDSDDLWWLEEYIVDPPTHIVNGFIWALWGVYDYMKITDDKDARELWERSLETLRQRLSRYNRGHWSLYDLSDTALPNVASPFYHSLHIVQLRIMSILSGDGFFNEYADRWESYRSNFFYRNRALLHKTLFKLIYF
jgi:uncharacterized protein YyaL (SSP411 family)